MENCLEELCLPNFSILVATLRLSTADCVHKKKEYPKLGISEGNESDLIKSSLDQALILSLQFPRMNDVHGIASARIG